MMVPLGRFSLAPRTEHRYPRGILRHRYGVTSAVACMTPITGKV
jgi:hypothetical protein